ncbi:hypothetical protein HanRHA438_Chr01g0037051 [Helianthus annuus]|nr:hypothetical protein HanHA89_Chr01g0031661 [Helianthus annuus]KAJ0949287.1 hypothetical protein HanRHA438_Chr01g0037051 [Helianthus annuus]
MFTSNYRRCLFGQKFIGAVLNLPKFYTFCPLGQNWLEISVNSCHVQCTYEDTMVFFPLNPFYFPHL